MILNPDDCRWTPHHRTVDHDLNGNEIVNIITHICTTPGHMEHKLNLPAGVSPAEHVRRSAR
jgi:hypothetical protein